tara:strand:+ start:5511 stop:5783 length:273 start_codon:yes stop_codon:yes gene_type:complete
MPAYKDKLVLDISDDEVMKDYLGSKSVGDECSFTVSASLDETTEDQAVFSIMNVTVNSYDEEEEVMEEDYSSEEGAPPVMLIGLSKKDKA